MELFIPDFSSYTQQSVWVWAIYVYLFANYITNWWPYCCDDDFNFAIMYHHFFMSLFLIVSWYSKMLWYPGLLFLIYIYTSTKKCFGGYPRAMISSPRKSSSRKDRIPTDPCPSREGRGPKIIPRKKLRQKKFLDP